MAVFPTTSHTSNYNAVTDFLNKCIAAGYTPNSALDVQSVLFSVVANMIAGGQVPSIRYYTATLSPAAVSANTSAEETFTVTGVVGTGDLVFVNKPTAQAGLAIVGVRASAANTVGITFGNFTGSPITPTASQAYKFLVVTP